MTLFPEAFFTALVYVAIALTIAGGACLIVLLARDLKGKNLW
jgi:hypothetical protein